MSTQHPFSIELAAAGKKFFRHWIFRHLSIIIESPQKIAILGKNGSGKSTLLQVISGYESLSEGSVRYSRNNIEIPREEIYRHISFAAPYLELIEEFTLHEMVTYHFRFKNTVQQLSVDDVINVMQLESSRNKIIKYFSSGMKQRTRLALAMLSEVDLILLDEPLSNLDKDGEMWYKRIAEKYLHNRTVLICSNQNEVEYSFCERNLLIADFK